MVIRSAKAATGSQLDHLECSRCGRIHDADKLQNGCPCGSPLVARYRLDRVRSALPRAALAHRAPNMWRYRELLPVRHNHAIVSMDEGFTPIYELPRLGASLGLGHLLVKDESTNPGGTFSSRTSSMVFR